jgi:hypothetical protein
LEQVRLADPAPPSRYSAEVTPHLEMICLKCLRKNPWRRYAHAFDFLRQLRQCMDDPHGRGLPDPQRPKRRPPGEEERS